MLLCVLSLINSKHDRETSPTKVSKLNLMLPTQTTRISSANVGEYYRIFTFSTFFTFSFWALFDTQLINFISKYVFLIIQDLRSKLLHRGSLNYRFYFENSRGRLNGLRVTNYDSSVGKMRLKVQKSIFTGL